MDHLMNALLIVFAIFGSAITFLVAALAYKKSKESRRFSFLWIATVLFAAVVADSLLRRSLLPYTFMGAFGGVLLWVSRRFVKTKKKPDYQVSPANGK